MTLQEKLDLEKPTDEQQSAVIHLYKEGKFYVAYQYSACLLKRYIKPDIHLVRRTRKDGFSYLGWVCPWSPRYLLPIFVLTRRVSLSWGSKSWWIMAWVLHLPWRIVRWIFSLERNVLRLLTCAMGG